MSDLDPHSWLVTVTANVTYQLLVSVTHSQELSIRYYQMKLKDQRKTESEIRRFSEIYAKIYVNEVQNKKAHSDEVLVKKCLDAAWVLFNEKRAS